MNNTPIINPEVVAQEANLELIPRADLPAIWDSFRAQFEKIKQTSLTLNVTSVEQKLEMKLARETRLAIKQLRVAVEKRRKELGEDLLRQTQKINGAAKELKDAMEALEESLEEQEKFAEREEEKRILALTASRTAQLLEVGAVIPANIGSIEEDAFQTMLADAVLLKKAKEEQARKEEEERLAKEKADREERERIRIENERLRAEAEEAERKRQAERAEAEAVLKAERARAAAEIAAKEKQERERREKENAAAAEKLKEEQMKRAEAEKKAAKERAEAEALRLKEQRRVEEIKRLEEESRKAAEEAAKAPDKAKLGAFAAAVRSMELPSLSESKTSMKLAETRERFAAFVEDLAAKM